MVVRLEDAIEGGQVDRGERPVGRVGHGPARAAQGRLLAPLPVRLGRAPMDVVAAARVDAAHVDALDRAGLGALEAGLALERAPLVVEQLQPAAELVRRVAPVLRILDRDLGLEEAAEGQRHALRDAETRDEAHQDRPHRFDDDDGGAVTNRLSSDGRQQPLPGEVHQLVDPDARQRPAHPDEDEDEGVGLEQEPQAARRPSRVPM